MKLTVADLADIARGAAFLGAGGGGDPYIGRMLATAAIEEFGMPLIVEPESLPDDANVYTIAMLGAPTVLVEKAACGDDVDLALRKLERHRGKPADALVCIEIGGVNSLVPIMAAARTGLPLVNADGMGRAFPEIQMVTFNVGGVPCTPLVIADDTLDSLIVETGSAKRAENLVRSAAVEFGCSVMLSSYAMSGAQLKQHGVHGTLVLALEIGRAIATGRRSGNPVEALLDCLRRTPYYGASDVLFDGKVLDLKRSTEGGFSVGHCRLGALDGSGAVLEVTFQNEHLAARENGELRAVVPDLICMIDRETAEPVPVEALRYGQRLKVLGVSAPPILRRPESLAVWGPAAFGLKDDYTPVEQLMARRSRR